MDKRKYNFVILGNGGEIYKYVYKDIENCEYAIYDHKYPTNSVLRFWFDLTMSRKINNYVRVPGKKIWLRRRIKKLKHVMEKKGWNNNICFILFAECIYYNPIWMDDVIKDFFPESKIVFFFQDLISTKTERINCIEDRRERVDLIYTYDKGEAIKYNLLYHDVPYSKLSADYNGEIDCDICFVGKAKDRLEEIIKAFEYFQTKGLKCEFYLTEVEECDMKYKELIHYNKTISYDKYLSLVARSRCVLEVVQGGSVGNTLRVYDAICFDKLLLSNNNMLSENSLYNSEYMLIYNQISEVDINSFLKKEAYYPNKDEISPLTFLEKISEKLELK